jgi:hypothetical protein
MAGDKRWRGVEEVDGVLTCLAGELHNIIPQLYVEEVGAEAVLASLSMMTRQ